MKIKNLKLSVSALVFSMFGFTMNAQEPATVLKDSILSIENSMGSKESVNSFKDSIVPVKKSNLKSWSVQAFIGQPLIYASFLESDFVSDIGKTYDFQLGVTKNINHAIGIQLLGNYGRTQQYLPNSFKDAYSITDYHSLTLMGDVNLSAIGRRLSETKLDYYKWALHAYVGVGTIGYNHDKTNRGTIFKSAGYTIPVDDAEMFNRSYFGQLAVGLRRRINQSFDLEFKQSFVFTNDASFDGTSTLSQVYPSRGNNSNNGGNVSLTSIGVHYKIGKKGNEHLSWVDPYAGIKSDILEATSKAVKICQVDNDKDGVCDEWDKQLTTPIGARVDGSGTALDVDLDQVIDFYDKCVTIPGEGNPSGCPDKLISDNSVLKDKLASINMALEGIDFDLNSAVIKPQYFAILDQAAFVMQEFASYKFQIEGHTDAQGSNYYNYVLSKKRAESVKSYLVNKNKVSPSRLIIVPKGETDLKNTDCQPHTNCDDDKNRQNRRIVFIPEV